jgi:flagellum-specific peptidoglycan hydrolase FlgJ
MAGRLWKKGQSGNPGGRPKAANDVRDLAREHTVEAIARLVHWMRQKKDSRASVAASQSLLERGWGKAIQPHAGADGEGAIEVVIRMIKDEE